MGTERIRWDYGHWPSVYNIFTTNYFLFTFQYIRYKIPWRLSRTMRRCLNWIHLLCFIYHLCFLVVKNVHCISSSLPLRKYIYWFCLHCYCYKPSNLFFQFSHFRIELQIRNNSDNWILTKYYDLLCLAFGRIFM